MKNDQMNLYLRYFSNETLVTNVEDALSFLESIDEIGLNERIANDVRMYFESENRFPKRYKVRPKIYFIMIKTDANSMEEFKDYRNRNSVKTTEGEVEQVEMAEVEEPPYHPNSAGYENDFRRMRDRQYTNLYDERYGWYEGVFCFKRVVTIPVTGKNEYRDTRFVARCKAMSGIDCYNRIVDHLHERVDKRSQFPSARGKNFSFTFLGTCLE